MQALERSAHAVVDQSARSAAVAADQPTPPREPLRDYTGSTGWSSVGVAPAGCASSNCCGLSRPPRLGHERSARKRFDLLSASGCARREHVGNRRGHEDVVLDADADLFVLDVDARLDREDHSGCERSRVVPERSAPTTKTGCVIRPLLPHRESSGRTRAINSSTIQHASRVA